MLEWTAYIKIFTTLLAIVNPLGAIPIFISLTGNMAAGERKRIINTASITVVVVLIDQKALTKFPFFVRRVFSGGVSNDEILRPEVRILLELLDKDGDRLSHVVREMYASR